MKDLSAPIDEILALSDLMPSTQEDLEDFKRDLTEGDLGKDDRDYIEALHKRLIGGGGMPSPVSTDEGGEDEDEDEDKTEAAIEALEAEVKELKQALADRDSRINELEDQLNADQSPSDDS